MADLSAAETAELDQKYDQTARVLDALIADSRGLLASEGAEVAASLLATGFCREYPVVTIASLLAVAIVRLQQEVK